VTVTWMVAKTDVLWTRNAGACLLIGSSKGEVSREECIEKIAASINYVHSQTANVITGTSQMSW